MNKKYNMFNLFRNDRKAYASEHKIQEFKEILLEKKTDSSRNNKRFKTKRSHDKVMYNVNKIKSVKYDKTLKRRCDKLSPSDVAGTY